MIKQLKLKNLRTFEGHDGMGFNADVWHKQTKLAHVFDSAHGASYEYMVFDRELWKQLLKEVDELPREKSNHFPNGLKVDIDSVVSGLVEEYLRKKDEKKGVLVECPGGYKIVGYRQSIPTLLKKYKDGLEAIQAVYDREIKSGAKVLNEEYLASVGVKLK